IRSAQVMQARESNWYATTPFGIAILRYEDANTLLKDKRLFQGTRKWPSHYGITTGPLANWWKSMLLSVEGDDHLRLRRLAGPAFSPKTIEPLATFFAQLANELIDNFQSKGSCEFMSEFAEPFSARVITGLLGLDDQLWPKVADYATKLGYVFSVTIKEDLPIIEEGLLGILDISEKLIDSRRGIDKDDFVGTLVKASVDDKKITDDELLSLVSLLIFAGFDTTRNQIGLGMQTFSKYPTQWKLLGEKPELARAAVEEVMRFNPTITWVSREASVDIVYKDLAIKAGTTIHLLTIPAGSDPRKFENVDFDITAERAPHFGFGGGMHHCIGHYVARLDMKEAFKALSKRLPNMQIAPGATYLPDSGNTGPTKLPITFSV
ncbi:MAG: cytochrome P450, partial [Actinobacteria bacterium]|nr:cytochrome P450 [Actinomycetota bacterium]